MKVANLRSIKIKLASPEEILSWSYGEVKRPETINYRTQRPEKDGLFCEKIFGPTKDYECYCGKYKGPRYKGVICDRCGVEVTRSQVRRERMGHIKLAAPVCHIWYLRGIPSRLGLLLDIPQQKLEKVIYFAGYIITKVFEDKKKEILKEIEQEFERKITQLKKEKLTKREKKEKKRELEELLEEKKRELQEIYPLNILSEEEFRKYSLDYARAFEAKTGAEAILEVVRKIDLKKEAKKLEKELKEVLGKKSKTPPLLLYRKKIRRLRLLKSMLKSGVKPEWMFLTVLPVLPPELRPMVQLDGGRYASSDLNDLYRRVINRNNRLKYLIEISAPEVIVRNEKRMLQEAVDTLLDNSMKRTQAMTTASTGGKRKLKSIADILSGKQGRFRRNLLGKRVDYSGRSVIAPGPQLKLHQCGLPKIMALELFKPFIVKKLLEKGISYQVRGASRLIEEKPPEVFEALEEVVKDKLVLLNRAPTLHRLGIQAFWPVLIEGKAIEIHPLVCKAYNADFDGDQMAVHLPLTEEAQKEAREIMLSSKNLLKPATGKPIAVPTQDMILGCYYLTGLREEEKTNIKRKEKRAKGLKKFSSQTEVILAHNLGYLDLREEIEVFDKKSNKFIRTTPGRIIFNEILPADFPFINERVDSKKLTKIVSEIIANYPPQLVEQTLDRIKDLGFEYATLSGVSWGMDDLIVPKEKAKLIKDAEKAVDQLEEQFQRGLLSVSEKTAKIISIWQEVKERVEKSVLETLPKEGSVHYLVGSGSRGSWAQAIQMSGMKGLVTSPAGRIIEVPIKHSFKEGFDILEYFISTHGARKGTADTALRTSKAGYLTRRLVDAAHEVIISERDCKDKNGWEIRKEDLKETAQDFIFKIVGRYSLEDIVDNKRKKVIVKKGEIIDWKKAKLISESEEIKKLRLRTPLSCKSLRGVCQICYGWEMGRNKLVNLGEAVGIVASQSIGEPGTQLTMRTFHLGGIVGGGDITKGLPRVEEVFELRKPKDPAPISEIEGKVAKIDRDRRKIVIISEKNKKELLKVEYQISPEAEVLVKVNQKVRVGDILTTGPVDIRALFRLAGKEAAARYILNEVQKVYAGEGIEIHDKHFEIIIKQMFSKAKIISSGDSHWVPGEIVTLAEAKELEKELKKKGKMPPKYQQTILGISKVALNSESFLSAASFQETSRVLISASLEGKEDRLRGLKENVIIGKLIPAGSGFFRKENEKKE